ncbi:MAG: succinate dehydrogenase cytochrome b subunit [Deltaproteobacteria bacterium]|nr:succinate dehydrogenase cytochrome b subunit [Deltaproteobacteria bacterium]
MNGLGRIFTMTVGLKFLMAVSGFILVGFLVGHLSGNMLLYAGPDAINQYAEVLKKFPVVLWTTRIFLIIAVFVHIYSGVKLSVLNKRARPHAYAVTKRVKATLPSQTMLLSGAVVLSFTLYHLAHFTFRWTHKEEFAGLGDFDVHAMMVLSFQSSVVSSFYVLSIVLLMMHLNHGLVSFFQTLGVNHSKYNGVVKSLSILLSIILALGFISLPISIYFGFVS